MSKVIVITGASSGIGEATSKILAKDGAKLVLAARREDRLKKLAEEIRELGGEAVYQVTDVRDVSQVEALAEKAVSSFGRIDVWFNNAGVMPQAPLLSRDIKDWDAIVDINIKGVLYGIAAALPRMVEQKEGQIINISSVAGHFAHLNGAVYSASKWAVRAISESLREEMAGYEGNLRVTVVSPGAVHSELLNSVHNEELNKNFTAFYENFAIPAERVALTIKQAIDLPADSAWNEVVIRPTKQLL